MANLVLKIILGIDVSKQELVVFNRHSGEYSVVSNTPPAIAQWLRSLHGPVQIAVEPTSHYHLALVDEALKQGHTVYLLSARALANYREAIEVRNKTDLDDARLLARYLEREGDDLRAFRPRSRKARQLWCLILRRGTVVQCRQRLHQSFAETRISVRGLIRQINQLLARLQQRIQTLLKQLGWWDHYTFCASVPGIGPANAAALTAAFHRGAFAGSDAFIAYLGLDVRRRESGAYRGKRKLTKRGEAEVRRLLYCAAQGAKSDQRFAAFHQRQLDKGLPKIAANIILARKLARIAFTLMSREEVFANPRPVTG